MGSIVFVFFLGSCTENIGSIEIVVVEDKIQKDIFLEGTWGMTNYFDTIVKYKEINKFRLQKATWFAILLEFKNDSLYTYGSIDENTCKFEVINDTISKLHGKIGNQNDYWLVKRDSLLVLSQINRKHLKDSIIYTFRKRRDLNNLVNNDLTRFKISQGVTDYFNKEILSGTYYQYFSTKKMSFSKNGEVINWSKFHSYEIDNYFGTSHPFGNLDVVTLSHSKKNKQNYYSWKFQCDSLVLTELKREEISYENKNYETDNWIESDNSQVLLKTK
jgi:hypothetical protein